MKFDPVAFAESGRQVRSLLDGNKQREARAALSKRCTEIADQVVPRYKQAPYPSCGGTIAKRWQAAWDAANIALGGDPAEYWR